MQVVYLARGLRSVSGDLSKPIPRWRDGWDEPDDCHESPFGVGVDEVTEEFRAMFS